VELFQAAAHHLMGMRFLEWLHDVQCEQHGQIGDDRRAMLCRVLCSHDKAMN